MVKRDGEPVTFDTRKAVALLALSRSRGGAQPRELADLLWPDADSAKGRASLRRTLSVTAVATGSGLTITRAAVTLELSAVQVDVREFSAFIARPDAASLERAVALYRDDFLAASPCEAARTSRTGSRRWPTSSGSRSRGACSAWWRPASRTGELERATGHARRWLQLDPLHEPAHQAIIRLYGWAGQRSAAMRQYRALVRILDRDLAVRPLPETTRLYEDVRADRLGPAPARSAGCRGCLAAAGVTGSGRARVPRLRLRPWRRPRPRRAGGPGDARGLAAGGAGRRAGSPARGVAGGRPAGRVVAIEGQVGSGKTRLITEFRTEAAQAGGGVVLAVRGHDGETALPFVLAADLLRTALAVRPDLPAVLPAQTAAMAGRLVPALAAAHPELGCPGAGQPGGRDPAVRGDRRYATGRDRRSGRRRGRSAGGDEGPRPVGVVVVEDVHFADSSSLGLLAYLVRRLDDWPLLLVLSWQPEQSGAAAGAAYRARRGRRAVAGRDDRAGSARPGGDRRAP